MDSRRLNSIDINKLKKIHANNHSYPFPDFNDPLYAIQRVVTEGDKIIVAGIIRITSEGLFITDKETSPFMRAKAIKILNNEMNLIWKFGINDCHTFAENDDNYINILRKLGFEDCTGHAMVKQKS